MFNIIKRFQALFWPRATANIEIFGKPDNILKHSCHDCPSHALFEINSRGRPGSKVTKLCTDCGVEVGSRYTLCLFQSILKQLGGTSQAMA